MSKVIVEVQDMSVAYGDRIAVDNLSLKINEGEVAVLIGPNGAGKSTVFNALFGLLPICSGKILFCGKDISLFSDKTVRKNIALVPQGKNVFNNLTVEENLELGGLSIKNKQELEKSIGESLKLFPDLTDKKEAKAKDLSGGQKQMLALARALISRPKVLLLDEPSLGLAPKAAGMIFKMIKNISRDRKIAVLMIEHNIKDALNISDKVYAINRGKMIFSGVPQDVNIRKVFFEA